MRFIESLVYFFGKNISFYKISEELKALEKNIPMDFKSREVIDIGCGDGNTSLKISRILKPKRFIGIDHHPNLVEAAISNGIKAYIADAENQDIFGDLGIMWGVLHHFKKPKESLKRIRRNFKSLIIRESIDDKRIFEIAHRYNKQSLMAILKECFNKDKMKIAEIKKTKTLLAFIDIQNHKVL